MSDDILFRDTREAAMRRYGQYSPNIEHAKNPEALICELHVALRFASTAEGSLAMVKIARMIQRIRHTYGIPLPGRDEV